jgi:ATP-dependent helicase HepA
VHDFIPGQRWINDAELNMGLGTILSVEHRTVTVLFLATGDTRTYAKATAPLTRVMFAPGDSVRGHESWSLRIDSIKEHNGLLTYIGTREDGSKAELEEGQLDNLIQLNRPTERLFTGQVDQDKWFELRYETLQQINRLAHSDLRGLTGGRTSMIPHQLYIAHEVANRYAPRVLLADEVGLGKTIEAGMILHQQLLTERAKRVLIVVPESLVHQWLVEMLRRFNLYFSIFDEERCLAIEESTEQDNPFHSEQLVLCNLEFLVSHPDRFQQALAGDWDLMVVDEAHHLQWSPQQVSVEYQVIEQLAAVVKGVLLLTATPEQLGKASHFARLRLLDPNRFPDFDTFVEEEKTYEPIAQAVEALLGEQAIDEGVYQTLQNTISEGDNQALLDALIDQRSMADEQEKTSARIELVEHLLDRHGTGRVLFRNTRTAVKGFPDRKVSSYPLPLPESYAECLSAFQTTGMSEPRLLLCPELLYQSIDNPGQAHWAQIDPRVNWLSDLLKQLRAHKVLVITASAETAMDLADALRIKSGIHAAVFHEGLSIIERDRAAAFFADQEYGSQVLLCSEIGSEGRNFQFAHHLILFDLPLNPDLLEQRIGRLDRIGQTETIQIHVPYLQNSAQDVMYHWYHEGLSAFEHTCPAGHNVFVQVEATLIEALHQIDDGIEDLPTLISTTTKVHKELNEALHRGRDRLLEYNSCRPHIANAIRDRALTQDAESILFDYLDNVFDCYGVDTEEHSENSYIVRPSDHMQTSSFPGLYEEGMTITCDRNTALANEDIQFISWEHPMVTGAMDMVLSSEMGNSAVTAIKYKGAKPGTLLLECLYILETASSDTLQSSRYLPPTTIRIVVDLHGNNHDTKLPHKLIKQIREAVDIDTANKIIQAYTKELRNMVSASEKLAHQQAPNILTAAHKQTKQTLTKEINRLQALRQVNPNVRKEEVQFFEDQWKTLTKVLESANFRLDALRVIVTT